MANGLSLTRFILFKRNVFQSNEGTQKRHRGDREGSFARSYPLSLRRIDGYADTGGKKGPLPSRLPSLLDLSGKRYTSE
jgi:hypothetical protein